MSDATTATDDTVAPDETAGPELLHGAPVTRRFGQRVAHVGDLNAVARP